METALSQAKLLISIDAGRSAKQGQYNSERELGTIVRQLLDTFTQHQMSATWALSDPASSPLSRLILGRNSAHEIAVFGDASWIGSHIGRRQFAKELQKRVERAKQTDINLATIALHGVELLGNLDLLVKSGIVVLRLAKASDRTTEQLTRPQFHRYGIWQIAPTFELPVSATRWFGQQAAFRFALKRAVRNRQVLHLRIDAAEFISTGKPAMHVLGRLLRATHQYRLAGALEVKTLGRAAADLAARPNTKRSRSVLRRVA
jgi:hypothetical protein